MRVRRGVVEAAIARAGIEEPSREARRMYASLGRGVFELLWLAGASDRRRAAAIDASVTVDMAALDEALARGAVVLCASHTGNWELAAAAAARLLAARGRRLAIVAKPFSSRPFDAFCTRLRTRLGIDVLRPSGAMTTARRALAAGACVAMPIDQVPDRAVHGVPVRFLGGDALVDRAPAVLARRAGASMLVVAASRTGGAHRVEVLASIAAPRSAGEVRTALLEATAALETFVLRCPSGWMWLHRRWRAPRDRLIDTAWTTPSSSPAGASRAA